MATGANKVETKSRHLIHMTSEVDLEVNMEVLPAEPRRSCGELFLSQLSVPDTIQACQKKTHTHTQIGFAHLDAISKQEKNALSLFI